MQRIRSGSETEYAAGVALVERDGHMLPLPVDVHDEPVAAALEATHGARELVRLLVAEPDATSVRTVNVLGVVARVGAERAHVRLHLLARSLLLRVLYDTAGCDEREGRQKEGATTSRQRARRPRPSLVRDSRLVGDGLGLGVRLRLGDGLLRSLLDLRRLEIVGNGCLDLGSLLGGSDRFGLDARLQAAASASAASARSRPWRASASALVAAT